MLKTHSLIGMVSAAAMALVGAASYANAAIVDVAVYPGYDDTGTGMAVSGSPTYTSTLNSGSTGFVYDWAASSDSVNDFGTYNGSAIFTAYFTGKIFAASAGSYSITIASDDASYLYINGGLAISDGGLHGIVTVTENVMLSAGLNSFQLQYGNGACCGALTSLQLNTAGSAISGVPEPATWAMMLLGFAGLGFVGYRKVKSGTAAFASA